MLIGDEPRDIVIDHNTFSHTGTTFIFAYGGTATDPREMYGVRLTNNAVRHSSYGINGNYFGYGNGIISAFFPGSIVSGNYFAGGSASRYPAGNLFAGTFEQQFVDAAAGDFRLRADSQLRWGGTDGRDIGADSGALQCAADRGGAGSGRPDSASERAHHHLLSSQKVRSGPRRDPPQRRGSVFAPPLRQCRTPVTLLKPS